MGQGNVQPPRPQSGKQLGLMALLLAKAGLRVSLGKPAPQLRQQDLREGQQATHRQRPRHPASDFRRPVGKTARNGQKFARRGGELPPTFGQRQALGMAENEQLQPETRLQMPDGGRNRRRGHIHLLRRKRHRPAIGHRDQVFQLAKGKAQSHGSSFVWDKANAKGRALKAVCFRSGSEDRKQNATYPAPGLSWFAFNLIQIERKPHKRGQRSPGTPYFGASRGSRARWT